MIEISKVKVVDNDVLKFINSFYAGSSGELEEFRVLCEDQHIPIIKRDTEGFLKIILKLYKPERILEIGTGAGYSSTVFAKTLSNSQITTLELIDKRFEAAKTNFEKYGVANRIKIIEGDATESLKLLKKRMANLDDNELYDFVFIDSAKSRYKEFFTESLLITQPKAIIICDNVLLDGRTVSNKYIAKHREKTSSLKMREFMGFLKEQKKEFNTSFFNIGDGLTVSIIDSMGTC